MNAEDFLLKDFMKEVEEISNEFNTFLNKETEFSNEMKILQQILLSKNSDNIDLDVNLSPVRNLESAIEIKKMIEGECDLLKKKEMIPQVCDSFNIQGCATNDTPISYYLNLDYSLKSNLSDMENNTKQLQEIFIDNRKLKFEEEFAGIRFSLNPLELYSIDNSQLCNNILETNNSLADLKQFYEDNEVIKESNNLKGTQQPSRSMEKESTNDAITEILVEMERSLARSVNISLRNE